MLVETNHLNTFKFKKYIQIIVFTTVVFILSFGFFSIELFSRLSNIEKSVQQHNTNMNKINESIATLNSAIGYGGYIHNFKNYLIRKDQTALTNLKLDFEKFNTAINKLTALYTAPDELLAIGIIKETIYQYQKNLELLKKHNKDLTVESRDFLVKVDDSEALNAIMLLKQRSMQLNESHITIASNAFNNVKVWLFTGSSIFLIVIFFAVFLFTAVKRLKEVYADLAKALNESDLLIANSPDAMLSITETGVIIRCNEQIEVLFGYNKSELLNDNITILLPMDIHTKHQAHLRSYFSAPHTRLMGEGNKQLFGKHKSGELIPIEVSLSSSVISGQKVSTATIRDITNRLETENKLKIAVTLAESNYLKLQQAQVSLNEKQMINMMLDNLPYCTLLLNEDGEVLLINQKLLKETSYSKEQLVQLNFDNYIQVSDSKHSGVLNSLSIHKKATTNQNTTFLGTLVTKYDSLIPVEINLSNYPYNNQVYTLLTFKNLSDVKVIEDKLITSVERFTRVISAIEDGIWEWDIVNNTVDYSPQLMKIIGCEGEDKPEFHHWFDHIHPEYRTLVQDALTAHKQTKVIYEIEYLGVNEKGEYNWFYSIGNSIFSDDNQPLMMSGSLRNIHHKKLLELAFAEKSQFLNTIYQGSSHAIWVLNVEPNDEFRFIEFNRTACVRINVTEQDIINKTISDLTPSIFNVENNIAFNRHYIECRRTKKHIDYVEYLVINNLENWYQTSLYPITNEDGDVVKIVGTSIDISEQKKSEKELEQHKVFLEKIIDSAVCGLYVFDYITKKNVTINNRYTEILGYDIELLNQHPDFMSLFHPDDLQRVINHMTKVADSKNGELYSLKYRFKSADGSWVWCYSFDCIVKYDEKGAPLLMLGTFVDITELTLLMDQLQESNEYLERFAFVASHDLQEPLRKITAFSSSLSQRLQSSIENDDTIKFEFSRLINASDRMREMIKDLLKLSKINSTGLELTDCSLGNIVKQSVDLLSHLIDEQSVEINVHNLDFELEVDVGLFIQLFQNLIANSIKFKSVGISPQIFIEASNKDGRIDIIYKDNGIGIEPKFSEQIFEPFRRLHSKDMYEGSGIGLALCRQIITVHGGFIECNGNVGQGTEFHISLSKSIISKET